MSINIAKQPENCTKKKHEDIKIITGNKRPKSPMVLHKRQKGKKSTEKVVRIHRRSMIDRSRSDKQSFSLLALDGKPFFFHFDSNTFI